MLTQAPRGTKDLYGQEILQWQKIERVMREVCRTFGLEEIRTPVFEHTELFLRGVGDTTDVVQKEMYTFLDKSDRSITLRPESTAGVARAYIEHGMHNQPQPTKLYYIAPTFRYEKAQAGRQRQFHQFGVEMIGSYSPAQDAEAIAVAASLLERLEVKGVTLKINSLGGNACRKKYNQKLRDYIGENLEKLCPACRERFEKNPLRVLDCKEKSCQKVLEGAPLALDCLDTECKEHFETLKRILDAMGIAYIVDPKIVRGLDYYTRTVFEFVTDAIGAQGTVCGGGRYDNLIAECGGAQAGAVGFGLGMERLLLVLEAQNGSIQQAPVRDIYIGAIGEAGLIQAQAITNCLRKAGIRADCDTVGRSVKAQMKYANKIGARYSFILGENELADNRISLKNMETGEVSEEKLSEIKEKMLAILPEFC